MAKKTAADYEREADELTRKLKEVRKLAKRMAAEEEAKRKEAERQAEINEAIVLGRRSRETMIGDVSVADFLMMKDDERRRVVTGTDERIMKQRDALLTFVQKTRNRMSDGKPFSYWDSFQKEHPDVFRA